MDTVKDKDALARFNAIVDSSTQQAVKLVSTYGKPRYIAALVEFIMCGMAIVGIQVVTMGLDFSKLITPMFWSRTLSLTMLVFLLFRALINARYPKTESRQNVIDAKTRYTNLNKNKTLDLKEYLVEFNLDTKIKVYINKINKRINRLERKKIKTYNMKKKDKLTTRINILKEEITKDRIKEVINFIHVKYYIVYYDDFADISRVGGNDKINTNGEKSYYKSLNKASLSRVGSYFIMTAILAISVWTLDDMTTIQIISNIAASVLLIISTILSAFIQADRIYDSTITAAYICKADILEQYYAWQAKKKESVKEEEPIKELNLEKPILIGTGKIEVAS